MTRRSIAGFLAAALALPAIAVAQTGTATSSPATSSPWWKCRFHTTAGNSS